MTLTILKEAEKWPPAKGEYILTKESLWIRCPECGELATLDDHTVYHDGTVEPSVVCPYASEGCKWHVFAKLEGGNPQIK